MVGAKKRESLDSPTLSQPIPSRQIRSPGIFRILNRFYTPLALLFKFYGSKEHEKEINTRKKHSRVDAYRFKSYSTDKDAMVLGQVDIDSLVIFVRARGRRLASHRRPDLPPPPSLPRTHSMKTSSS